MATLDASGLVTESIVWLNKRELDLATAIQLGGWLSAKVNGFTQLKGAQKQELVCRVVEEVVLRQMPAGDVRDALLVGLKAALPAALGVAVDAARGRLDLKKVSVSCFAKWFLCIARSAVDVAEAAKVVDAGVAKKIDAGLDQAEAVKDLVLRDPEAAVEAVKEKVEDVVAETVEQVKEKVEAAVAEKLGEAVAAGVTEVVAEKVEDAVAEKLEAAADALLMLKESPKVEVTSVLLPPTPVPESPELSDLEEGEVPAKPSAKVSPKVEVRVDFL